MIFLERSLILFRYVGNLFNCDVTFSSMVSDYRGLSFFIDFPTRRNERKTFKTSKRFSRRHCLSFLRFLSKCRVRDRNCFRRKRSVTFEVKVIILETRFLIVFRELQRKETIPGRKDTSARPDSRMLSGEIDLLRKGNYSISQMVIAKRRRTKVS